MSEEKNDQLQPQENESKPVDNQDDVKKVAEELSFSEQEQLANLDIENDKSADAIVGEIDSDIARSSEEDTEGDTLEFDRSKYKQFTLRQIVDEFRDLMEHHPVGKVKQVLYYLRDLFQEKYEQQKDEARQKYIKVNDSEKGFYFRIPEKTEFDSLNREFKRRLNDARREYQEQLQKNLEAKQALIEELKKMALGEIQGSSGELYKRYREIRHRWYEIKNVPRNAYNDLWNNFVHWDEQFHRLISFDKEYREKIYEENLAEKQKIIDRAKKLLEHEDPMEAFRELQFLHKVWKEKTGPVAPEWREKIWQEFKDLTKKIHDRRREFLAKLKDVYAENLEKKREVIARIRALTEGKEITEHKVWQDLIKEVDRLREEFFAIGFVPWKERDTVKAEFYDAFRDFNRKKNAFYKGLKEKQKENLRKKREIIERARELLKHEDIKEAHEECKQLREEWKQIGFVPRKFSESIWEEFNQVCKEFYDRYYSEIKAETEEEYQNYLAKKAFLADLKKKNAEGELDNIDLDGINAIIEEWKGLGHVPENVRYINAKFNRFINNLYRKLNIDENEMRLMKFRNQMQELVESGQTKKLEKERRFILSKIEDLEKEILQSETNLMFFKTDDEDNPVLRKLKQQIERQKSVLKLWKDKLDIIDSLDY